MFRDRCHFGFIISRVGIVNIDIWSGSIATDQVSTAVLPGGGGDMDDNGLKLNVE
jgi:hypothetical protein